MCHTQKLSLYKNLIGDDGVTALAKACAGGALASVTVLSLAENKIGDEGMIKFSEALAGGAMAHLRDLYLSGNSISDKTKDTMRTAMSNRSVSVHF